MKQLSIIISHKRPVKVGSSVFEIGEIQSFYKQF